MKSIDLFFENKEEPLRSTLLALHSLILSYDEHIESSIKYGMPFYTLNKKMFCYIWMDKKTKEPYIGIVAGNKIKHVDLIQGKRKKMKILPIDSSKNFPKKTIFEIFDLARPFYLF